MQEYYLSIILGTIQESIQLHDQVYVIIKMMHRILMKKKMTRLIGKENKVAALCMTEIK